MHAFVVVMS